MKTHYLSISIAFVSIIFQSLSTHAQLLPASAVLDINNVSATVNSDGALFDKHTQLGNVVYISEPGFEVPAGSGKNSVFASGLWIGGIDPGGSLHTACQTYKQTGNDFVAGPKVNMAVSANMNKVWKINQSVIDNFVANNTTVGFTIPQEILDWPGNYGSAVFAPFYDLNNNGIYEPNSGDYPSIKGDQAIYFVFNDNTSHTESNGLPMDIEVHGMAYAFNSPNFPELNNTIFVEQRIKNNSAITYDSTYISLWNDFDIGNSIDDFIGTDVLKNMLYAYNSDSLDEGQMGYGPNPPAMGLVFLNKSLNYTYGYRNDFSVFGNPTSSLNYYNYMRAIDKNGNHLQYDTSSLAANYIFPGSSDSAFAGLYWAQNASNGTDWRSLGTHGPFTFNAGAVIDLEVAYVFHQDNTNSIAGLKSTASQVKSLYDLGLLGINSIAQSAPEKLHISPNPMKEHVRIAFSNTLNQVYTLKLIDAQGSVVFEQNNIRGNQVMLDKQNLASGLYFVMLQSADKMLQGKLTIE